MDKWAIEDRGGALLVPSGDPESVGSGEMRKWFINLVRKRELREEKVAGGRILRREIKQWMELRGPG